MRGGGTYHIGENIEDFAVTLDRFFDIPGYIPLVCRIQFGAGVADPSVLVRLFDCVSKTMIA